MNEDYDEIEKELKEKEKTKKEIKKSGRSVFKLKEIIEKKANSHQQDEKQQH